MTVEPATTAPADSRLHQAIAAYLEAVAAGQEPDRAALLARHPDLAAELRAFFTDHDRLRKLAGPPKPPAAGTRVRYVGDYELLGELGRGGMGVVYRARQNSLGRTVAVKMILAGQLATPEDVRRFHAEAQAAASLDHPGIVPVHEVGEHDGLHFFSMKLLDGGSLAQRFANPNQALPPADLARTLAKVARAVHFAHHRGVLHRDLKPSNVLFDAEGEPHVTDFGLAKWVRADATLTLTGNVVGTPAYMAPEQATGSATSVAADVFSLGAILYDGLTGRAPFRATTPLEALDQVRRCDIRPPRALDRRVPRDLEAICLKCLEKDPKRRYPTAAALAEDLDRFARGEAIARPRFLLRLRWPRARLTVGLGCGLVAGLMALFLVGSMVFYRARSAEAQRAAAEAMHYHELVARRQAEANYEQAKRAVDEMLRRLAAAKEPEDQRALRNQLLEKARQVYAEAGTDGPATAQQRHDFARLLLRVGHSALKGDDRTTARLALEEAVRLLDRADAWSNRDGTSGLLLAAARTGLGQTALAEKHPKDAEAHFTAAVDLLRRLTQGGLLAEKEIREEPLLEALRQRPEFKAAFEEPRDEP
jgi:hypothetical protein